MPQGKYYRISYGIILFLLMVYLTTKISFLLQPFVMMIKVLLVPLMLSGFFFLSAEAACQLPCREKI